MIARAALSSAIPSPLRSLIRIGLNATLFSSFFVERRRLGELLPMKSSGDHEVQAADVHLPGTIGKVERINYERTCLIVSTSRLFGKRYVVPVGSVERVDMDSRKVLVDLSKEEVENSPNYDDHQGVDEECQATVGAYYGDLPARRSSVR